MARGTRPRKIDHHWILDVVALNLREAMEKDGRSARKLGADARVGRKSVERLRAGKNATLTTLGAVADQLGITPVELLLVRQRTPLVSSNAATAQTIHTSLRNSQSKKLVSGKN